MTGVHDAPDARAGRARRHSSQWHPLPRPPRRRPIAQVDAPPAGFLPLPSDFPTAPERRAPHELTSYASVVSYVSYDSEGRGKLMSEARWDTRS
ncbi:hypothetical protein HNR68_002070 [Saccharopolyspora hordei]|uniref:Uncharacterized protein n=1 Tax=Saccharopolyspora hordei TaxID=1838 RepID=A0A853AQW2_9PSEU|nr:hypothetical protein [Saccharopolyspora hordei]